MSSARNPVRSLRLLRASCLRFIAWLVADGQSGARREVVGRRIGKLVDRLDRAGT